MIYKIKKLLLKLLVCCVVATPVIAADGWQFTTYVGASYSADAPLKIRLADQSNIDMTADYDNRSFEDSHYWIGRFEKWHHNKALGFEVVHHKVYLKNTTSIVEDFSISDGFNLVYVNWAKKSKNAILRYGLGVVIGHPDVTIKDRDQFVTKGSEGLYLSGPSVQISYERELWQKKLTVVTLETKGSLSYAKVPVSNNDDEYAETVDVAFHIALGVGRKLPKQASLTEKALFLSPYLYSKAYGFILN
ncbi:hypothetical protein DID76_03395 [Candidatus Marinamargulisbacteria bacterium SCGC AG-414-C22]|nr:hypothetical protein DID76_03395 [Candidatus Marinamargulisbacteria bacterium SCGC AG-414-C22]